MTDREVMQMALETAEQIACADYRHWEELASLSEFERWARSRANHIAEALRTALAQPEPDARKLAKIHQAAWNAVHKDYKDDPECCFALGFDAGYGAVAQKVEPSEMKSGERFESFPASPNKEWVGLTDEERKAIYEQADTENWHDQPLLEAVEAKLKEKNNG